MKRPVGMLRRAGRWFARTAGVLRAALTRPLRQRATRTLPTYDRLQQHPGFGATPERVVQIFRTAERGFPKEQCDLFDDLVENDGHLRNLFEQRSQAVAGKPWVIQAGGPMAADQEAARALKDTLRSIPQLTEFFEHQLSFNLYGWAASEIDWERREGKVVPTGFVNVPARRFRFGETGELRLLNDELDLEGEALWPGKWVVTRRRATMTARAGLMRTATWFALFKRLATRDWVVFAEKFGIPLVWAEYDEGLDDQAKHVAEEIVESIGEDGQAVVAKGVEVHIEAAARDGHAEGIHGHLVAYCNREMSKLVNGSTLANDNGDSGGASYALGNVHDHVRFDNVVFDAERLAESFRDQVSLPFVRYNGLDAAPPLLKVQVVKELDPLVRAQVASILTNELGIAVSQEQMRQELGFMEPANEADAAVGVRPLSPEPQEEATA
jgi:phage gp29-like protein